MDNKMKIGKYYLDLQHEKLGGGPFIVKVSYSNLIDNLFDEVICNVIAINNIRGDNTTVRRKIDDPYMVEVKVFYIDNLVIHISP